MKKKFLKKILPIFLAAVLVGTISVPTLSKEDRPSELVLDIHNQDESTVIINAVFPEIKTGTSEIDGKAFAKFEISNEVYTTDLGKARIPVIRRMIEIPEKAEIDIKIISTEWETTNLKDLRLPEKIIPVQHLILKTKNPESELVIDDEYYSKDKYTYTDVIKIIKTGNIRQRNFAQIEIQPMQYNPSTGQIKIMISCEMQIDFKNADIPKTYENIQDYQTEGFEKLFENIFENYGFYEKNAGLGSKSTGYLIITYDNFYDEILPFADWKDSIGYELTVTNTSQIPGGVSTTNIYNYINDAYTNWPTPPTYVLLVGDTTQIPTYIGPIGGTAADLYYETMNSDMFPDIMLGRFPASQESHVIAMVNKTIYYEQGIFPTIEWIKKAAFMAGNDNYQISEGTHNYVISNYLEPNNYTCDKIYEVTYGGTTQDVTNALNDGRSLAIFSGHGSTTSWADGPTFTQNNVRSLTNHEIYPLVCSHACVTGKFTEGECFGETWLREADKAGLAFWGSSHNTYWDPDDVLEKEMFEAWWDDNLETIGGMTDQALYEHYQYQSGGYYGELYLECYNILGDPSIEIYKENPGPIETHITNLDPNWNFVSLPFNENVSKIDIKVLYNGDYYSWLNATTSNNPTGSPLIDPNTFGWDRSGQTYELGSTFDPGYGYWVFSYQTCELLADVNALPTNQITDLEPNGI